MKKLQELLKNKKSFALIGVLFAAAIALILTSAIGGSRAALTYFSQTYDAQVAMYDIGVTLTEQGTPVSYRNYAHFIDQEGNVNSRGEWVLGKEKLLQNMLESAGDKVLQIGKSYDEALGVTNSGTINEFVKVSIFKYWVDQNGNKVTNLSPKLIDIKWANLGTDWLVASESDECMVLYYNKLLYSGASTAPFTQALTVYIDDSITQAKHETREGNVIYYTYDYNGYQFQIEAQVDAVQEHNAADAILSAWGTNVGISGDSLILY